MSEAVVNITIDGKPVAARPGQTVMQAAASIGIDIPGLCNHPHLKPEGACRICLVEIEKQRNLQPACTFPVSEGLVVQTETPRIAESRRFALQMLFSERSHYCMVCPSTGDGENSDCELQRLGYRYGLTHWQYAPDYEKPWEIDASRKFFVMHHSRCILCRRCVRACNQIAANHTLGVKQRGARTLICADDDVPFGESTCISCGTCLQVCPTGALVDRRSAFMGHEGDFTKTRAVCMGCAVGCGIRAFTRDNQLLRVEGDWDSANEGLLCAAGRFEIVEPRPPRILKPLVRQDWRLVETTWDKALAHVAAKFRAAQAVAGLASPRLPTESLAALACFFEEALTSHEVALLYGDAPPSELGRPATMADLRVADCIVVIGGDPLKDQKVVGYLVRRARDAGAKVIVVDDSETGLDKCADVHLELEDISYPSESPFERLRHTYHLRAGGLVTLKSALTAAQRPVVLYGSGLSTTVCASLRAMPPKVRFMPLVVGTNTLGARRLGLQTRPVLGDAVYVLLGDDMPNGTPPPHRQFTVIQAAYRSSWTESADVVLPAQTWAERRGHILNVEARAMPVTPLLEAPPAVPADWETLLQLSMRMGYELSMDAISGMSQVV